MLLNVKLAEYIDGMKNGATTSYKPRNYITVPHLLVRSVLDTMVSSWVYKNIFY